MGFFLLALSLVSVSLAMPIAETELAIQEPQEALLEELFQMDKPLAEHELFQLDSNPMAEKHLKDADRYNYAGYKNLWTPYGFK